MNGSETDPGSRKVFSPALVLLPVLTAAGVAVSLWSGAPTLLPLLTTAAAYPVFFLCIKRKEYDRCVFLMCLWAVALSGTIIGGTIVMGEEAGGAILHGEAYKVEMFRWIYTGEGAESDPATFLPLHARDFAVFAVLALLSGGLLGLLMGSVLTAYMSYYVGMLFVEGNDPLIAASMGWHVWSILRVIGFIFAATALASVFFARVRRQPLDIPLLKRYGIITGSLLVADVVLKALLAPFWQETLKGILSS